MVHWDVISTSSPKTQTISTHRAAERPSLFPAGSLERLGEAKMGPSKPLPPNDHQSLSSLSHPLILSHGAATGWPKHSRHLCSPEDTAYPLKSTCREGSQRQVVWKHTNPLPASFLALDPGPGHFPRPETQL